MTGTQAVDVIDSLLALNGCNDTGIFVRRHRLILIEEFITIVSIKCAVLRTIPHWDNARWYCSLKSPD